jgi:hypothetical protein
MFENKINLNKKSLEFSDIFYEMNKNIDFTL